MRVTTLGIDLAKSIFQLHGVDEPGNLAVQKRVTRKFSVFSPFPCVSRLTVWTLHLPHPPRRACPPGY
jgi:hypothetical protein